MRSFLVAMTCLVLGACAESSSQPADLLIRDVKVFDSRQGTVTPEQSVFIRDGIIVDIRTARDSDQATQIIEGGGRLLTPGFIDTHIHLSHLYGMARRLEDQDRALTGRTYLSHSVTTIADMGQPIAWLPTLVDWSETSVPDNPDLVVVAGSLGTLQPWDRNPPLHHDVVETPEAAAAKVLEYTQTGANRIKLYWKLEPDHMDAAMAAIKANGLTAYAHVDNGHVSITEAMDRGVGHFEHFFTTQRSIADPDDLLPVIRERHALPDRDSLDEWTLSLSFYHDQIERDPDLKARLDSLFERMAAENATLSTALNIMATAAGRSDTPSFFDTLPPRNAPLIRSDYASDELKSSAFDSVLKQIGRAHELGVALRIGTDAPNGGKALRAELQLLAEVGIPIGEVLQIATYNGATALGIADQAGEISVGRSADLVLFDQDPFADLDHFQSNLTVIKDGQVFDDTVSGTEALIAKITSRTPPAFVMSDLETIPAPPLPSELAAPLYNAMLDGDMTIATALADAMEYGLRGEPLSDYMSEYPMIEAAFATLTEENSADTLAGLEIVLRAFADQAGSWANYGQVLMIAGRMDEAERALEEAVALAPDNEPIAAILQSIRDAQDAP